MVPPVIRRTPGTAAHSASSLEGNDVVVQRTDGQETLGEILAKKRSPMSDTSRAHWLVDSHCFTVPVVLIIIANAVVLGISTDVQGSFWDDLWNVMERGFTMLFIGEMIIKLAALRCRYFHDNWNIFDMFLVLIAVIDWIVQFALSRSSSARGVTVMRILRLCRLVRILRMVEIFSELTVLLSSILRSVKTLSWVVLMIIIFMYCYAIICVEFIGRSDSGFQAYSDHVDELENAADNFNNYQYFGTVLRALLSLFSIITLSEWSTITRPVSEVQPLFIPLFVLFTFFTTFGVLNVVIGVLVEHAMDASAEFKLQKEAVRRERLMEIIVAIKHIMMEIDLDGDGSISFDELDEAMQSNPVLAALIEGIGLPANCTMEELFAMLNENGDQFISPDEFQQGMFRLIFCSDFQRMCLLQMSINKLKRDTMNEIQDKKTCMDLAFPAEALSAIREIKAEVQRTSTDLASRIEALSAGLGLPKAEVHEEKHAGDSTSVSRSNAIDLSKQLPVEACELPQQAWFGLGPKHEVVRLGPFYDVSKEDLWSRVDQQLLPKVVPMLHHFSEGFTGKKNEDGLPAKYVNFCLETQVGEDPSDSVANTSLFLMKSNSPVPQEYDPHPPNATRNDLLFLNPHQIR